MSSPNVMIAPVIAFIISAAATYVLSRSSRFKILDEPNARSLHRVPITCTGGLAIFVAIVVAGAIGVGTAQETRMCLSLLVGVTIVAAVSFLDDLAGLSVGVRLAAHLVAALILIGGWVGVEQASMFLHERSWLVPIGEAGVVAIGIVWMINLYNFMDGMDGLAAGMAVIGFGVLAYLGWLAVSPVFMTLSLVVTAAAAGFLVFNFPPARIFMGDTGSSTLGFVAGAFLVWGTSAQIFSLWIGLLVFSPFVVDATLTLVRRLVRNENIFQPHKTHYYQRVVELGWGHRKTALFEYGLMALCGISAILATQSALVIQLYVAIFWALIYLGIVLIVTTREKVRRRENYNL